MHRRTAAALILAALTLAACGSDDPSSSGNPVTTTTAADPTPSSSTSTPSTTTTTEAGPPDWTASKSLPGATIERGETFEGHDLWVDTTNHVVYAEDCDVARRATKQGSGGPYEPKPDSSGTVIAYGWTCPTA